MAKLTGRATLRPAYEFVGTGKEGEEWHIGQKLAGVTLCLQPKKLGDKTETAVDFFTICSTCRAESIALGAMPPRRRTILIQAIGLCFFIF